MNNSVPTPGHSPLPLQLIGASYEVDGKRLIDHIDLELHAGTRTLVLGPNGAGKSLLLRLCHGLLMPTSGSVSWSLDDRAALRRSQALVFQRPVLLRRSVRANIEYALAVHGADRDTQVRRAGEALERTGLTQLAARPARGLSGGEQQRLALARAWALEPAVLFLDEPTANLDPASTRSLEALVEAIHRAGTKIVMTSHDLGQAHRLADEVLFLHRGRLVERAAADDFFAAPRSEEARAFLAGDLYW